MAIVVDGSSWRKWIRISRVNFCWSAASADEHGEGNATADWYSVAMGNRRIRKNVDTVPRRRTRRPTCPVGRADHVVPNGGFCPNRAPEW